MKKEYLKLPLSDLHEAERNVRIHSDKQIKELMRSVSMFGQTRAIVCDENHMILIGNGLYASLVQLGWTEADCYVITGLSESDKKKLMLADNKIYSLGVDDLETFEEFVAELGKDFDIPGYDPSLLETLSFEFDDADDFMSGYGIIDEETKSDMERASEKYVEEGNAFAASAERIIPNTANSALQQPPSVVDTPAHAPIGVDSPKEQETHRNELERRFIVCPKCGERIWL